MAITLVQHKSAAVANVNTPAADFSAANFLWAGIAFFGLDGTITDTFSNTYTGRTTYNTGNTKARGWYVASPTVSNSFQGHTNAGFPCIELAGFSGVHATPFDTEDGNSNASNVTSINAGATGVTPSVNGCLIVTVLCLDGTYSSPTIDNGFTILDSQAYSASNNMGMSTAYLIQGTAGTINPQWSWTTARHPAVGIYVFKPSTTPPSTSFPAAILAA